MAHQHVPSPEELKLHLERLEREQKLGKPQAHALDIARQQADVRALERKVKELTEVTLSRGRRTPHELRAALDLLMDKYDMEPAEELVKMVMAKRELEDGTEAWRLSDELRIRILQDLVQYRMPKLKSVETTGTVEHKHEIVIVRYGDDGTVRKEIAGKAPEVIDVEVAKA